MCCNAEYLITCMESSSQLTWRHMNLLKIIFRKRTGKIEVILRNKDTSLSNANILIYNNGS